MGAVAADRNQCVKVIVNRGQHAFSTAGRIVEVVACGPEQRPALGDDPLKVARQQRFANEFRREAGPTIGDTNDFVTVAKGQKIDFASQAAS